MGVPGRRTPHEGLASQLGEPSCDIPDPFYYPPGLRTSHVGRIFMASRVIWARRSLASRAGSVTYSKNKGLVSIRANFTCSG